jgi:hypothetical protein
MRYQIRGGDLIESADRMGSAVMDSSRGHFAFLLRRMSKFAESESLYRSFQDAAALQTSG